MWNDDYATRLQWCVCLIYGYSFIMSVMLMIFEITWSQSILFWVIIEWMCSNSSRIVETPTVASLLAIKLLSVVSPPLAAETPTVSVLYSHKESILRAGFTQYMIIHQLLHLRHANILNVHYRYNLISSPLPCCIGLQSPLPLLWRLQLLNCRLQLSCQCFLSLLW